MSKHRVVVTGQVIVYDGGQAIATQTVTGTYVTDATDVEGAATALFKDQFSDGIDDIVEAHTFDITEVD